MNGKLLWDKGKKKLSHAWNLLREPCIKQPVQEDGSEETVYMVTVFEALSRSLAFARNECERMATIDEESYRTYRQECQYVDPWFVRERRGPMR